MFESHEKSTGTNYTMTVALLSAALIVSPAFLFVSRPVGLVSLSVAAVFTTVCVGIAWLNWKKNSDLTIPSCH